MANTFFLGSDHLIEYADTQNVADGSYINDATVSVTVKTRLGTTVAGPIAMPYVTASNGLYQGTLPHDMAVTLGVEYVAEITIDGGAGLVGLVKLPFTARDRIT